MIAVCNHDVFFELWIEMFVGFDHSRMLNWMCKMAAIQNYGGFQGTHFGHKAKKCLDTDQDMSIQQDGA